MSDTSMFFNIFGRDMGVGTMFEEVAHKGTGVTGSLKGIGAAAAGIGFVKLGMDAVKSFDDVAGATFKLQKETGASAEEASRLNFVLENNGLTADDTAKSFGRFSKNLVASTADTAKHAEMVNKLGFEYVGTDGKILPLTELLPKLSQKFQEMPDGVEKNALALQLFGRSGQDMIPMLDRGGESMSELVHRSDELNMTIGQENVDAFREAQLAGRDWDHAVQGLSVTVGAALLPAIHGIEQVLRGVLIPAMQSAEGWFKSLPGPVQGLVMVLVAVLAVGGPLVVMLASFGSAIMTLIPIVTAIGGALSALWTILMANPIFIVVGLIAVFVASLIFAYNNVGWFRDFVNGAFQTIQAVVSTVINFITGTLVPLLVNGWNNAARQAQVVGAVIAVVWNTVTSNVSNMVNSVVSFLTGLGANIAGIWNGIVSNTSAMIGNVVGFFMGLPGRILGALGNLGGLLWGIGKSIIDGLLNGLKAAWDGVTSFIGGIGNWIAQHKGPEEYDRTLLVPHGGWILGGLMTGIQASLPKLAGVLAGVTDMVSGTVAKASVNIGANVQTAGAAVQAGQFRAQQQPQPVLDLRGYALELNADATKATFKKIADGSATSAVQTANDDIYRGRAR